MKKITFAISLFLLSASAMAWTIGPMNYQGRLLDNTGIPLTGSYNFKVRIYDAISGGTLKFSENQNSVAVDDGVYSFLISTGTSPTGTWDINLWNTPSLYLEIEVNSQILTPRQLLASAPFAFQANLALTTNNALALGGVSASQYNNTLASICTSGKGKWLELANAGAGACLGIGASFPGPTQVNWNTLTASNDFTNLDLSRANISGIKFGSPTAANMTGTLFAATTYSVAGMSGANLTNTVWDGAIANDVSAFTVIGTTNLTGATMKNMNMSKWNLSSITNEFMMHYFSAAYLSACPAAVWGVAYSPWVCKKMHSTGSQYFMAGFYANFSTTSAAAITTNGEVFLDVDANAFDNVDTGYSRFNGAVLTQSFLNGSFYQADVSYATLRNINFTNTNFNGTFTGSKWENITLANGISMSQNDFTDASLSNVIFYNDPAWINFTRANLKQVDFANNLSGLGGANFTDATLENVRFSVLRIAANAITFDRTRIYGNFQIDHFLNTIDPPLMTFKDISFVGATISGALTDITFTGTIKFQNVVFKNLDLCSTVFPLVDVTAPHDDLLTVKWEGPIECPDGSDVVPSGNLYSNTCNYLARMTQTAVANCTAGVPGALQ